MFIWSYVSRRTKTSYWRNLPIIWGLFLLSFLIWLCNGCQPHPHICRWMENMMLNSLTTRKWDEQGRSGNALWDAPVCQLEQEARHRHPGRRHQNCLSRTGRNAPHCHLLRSHQNRIVTKVNKYLSANTFSVILLRTSPQSSKSCIQDRREFATIWKTRTGPRSTWDDIDTHRGERETDCQNGPTCPSYPKQKPALQTHTLPKDGIYYRFTMKTCDESSKLAISCYITIYEPSIYKS